MPVRHSLGVQTVAEMSIGVFSVVLCLAAAAAKLPQLMLTTEILSSRQTLVAHRRADAVLTQLD